MAGESLEISALEVSYGETKVLKGVTISVAGGEFIALLGASGCGKTTLLRAISGFAPVESGTVRVSGRDITHLPPDRRDMTMVFQSYALWPHMTVAQNIGYGLRLRRMPRDDIARRTDEMLAMLRLEGLGQRSVTQLSGGQRQRVALGRALAVNPRILLLDEPLSNLDARVRVQVRHEIKTIQQDIGITAIHVTHDREEAMIMADRLIILNDGAIAQSGTPEDIYNRPASPFVASFMGADNVIRLVARRENGAIAVEAGPHNDAARLAEGAGGCHAEGLNSGPALLHFRSEAARLRVGEDAGSDQLVLRGRITQSSYPGGFYRHAVAIGDQLFMVDDERRFAIGEEVGIWLPAGAIHLYPEASA